MSYIAENNDPNAKAQIDLLIERRDGIINICEMKFSVNEFVISKKYAEEIRNKIQQFKVQSQTNKSLFFTMVTTFGVASNEYSGSFVQNSILLDDFFKEI